MSLLVVTFLEFTWLASCHTIAYPKSIVQTFFALGIICHRGWSLGISHGRFMGKKRKKVLKIVLYFLFSFCFLADFACFVGFIVVYYNFFYMLIVRI